MWRSMVGAILGVCVMLGVADAQVQGCNLQKKWNANTAILEWEFTSIVDPAPTGIRIKIGTAPGQYSKFVDFPTNQFSTKMTTLIPGPGLYYARAVVLEGTTKEEGGQSAECFFDLDSNKLALGVKAK